MKGYFRISCLAKCSHRSLPGFGPYIAMRVTNVRVISLRLSSSSSPSEISIPEYWRKDTQHFIDEGLLDDDSRSDITRILVTLIAKYGPNIQCWVSSLQKSGILISDLESVDGTVTVEPSTSWGNEGEFGGWEHEGTTEDASGPCTCPHMEWLQHCYRSSYTCSVNIVVPRKWMVVDLSPIQAQLETLKCTRMSHTWTLHSEHRVVNFEKWTINQLEHNLVLQRCTRYDELQLNTMWTLKVYRNVSSCPM